MIVFIILSHSYKIPLYVFGATYFNNLDRQIAILYIQLIICEEETGYFSASASNLSKIIVNFTPMLITL